MRETDFWGIIRKINWYGGVKNSPDAVATCKARALQELSNLALVEQFRQQYLKQFSRLDEAIRSWEERRGNYLPVGDDGYGDLISHIIGLGKDEVERTINCPILAWERCQNRYGTVDSYVECFSYCIPDEEDFEAIEVKLDKARDGLNYWIERMSDDPTDDLAEREVERRCKLVGQLRAQMQKHTGAEDLSTRFQKNELIQAKRAQMQVLCQHQNRLQKKIDSLTDEIGRLMVS